MAQPAFRPEAILQQAKNNRPAGIRALVEAGVPVEFCNQARGEGQAALSVLLRCRSHQGMQANHTCAVFPPRLIT